nr:MmcQ/YjbR family DNA-binding protein [Mangrovicoccus sp. HB161399]
MPGAEARPHFDRTAYRVRKGFATLAPDRASANLFLSPEEQEHWCALLPGAFAPVPNKWGARGATTVTLDAIDEAALLPALRSAWRAAGGRE